MNVRDPLPVLLYHAICRSEGDCAALGSPDRVYAVSEKLFGQHLDALRKAGYKLLGDIEAAFEDAGRRVVVTFDDSLPTHERAAEMLVARGARGLFLLCTDEIGESGRIDRGGVDRLAKAGMFLGSHGARHEFLPGLSEDQLRENLESSLAKLNDWPEAARPMLSFPGGRFTMAAVNTARGAGFKRFLTSERSVNDADLRPVVLGRINVTRQIGPGKLLKLVGRTSIPLKEMWVDRVKLMLQSALGDRAYMQLWNARHRRARLGGR